MGSVCVTMASVRILLYSAILATSLSYRCRHFNDFGCSSGPHYIEREPHHHYQHAPAPVIEKRIHVTHEVHHIIHKKRRRRPRPHPDPVDHPLVVVDTPHIPVLEIPVDVSQPVAGVPAVLPSVDPSYNLGVDPRLVPVLKGSKPQEGDPLGIYPGGGLDPRINPSLVPVARRQLEDQVKQLRSQLDTLTRRLGLPIASGSDTTDTQSQL